MLPRNSDSVDSRIDQDANGAGGTAAAPPPPPPPALAPWRVTVTVVGTFIGVETPPAVAHAKTSCAAAAKTSIVLGTHFRGRVKCAAFHRTRSTAGPNRNPLRTRNYA